MASIEASTIGIKTRKVSIKSESYESSITERKIK
jgi:hypothetical protein